LTAFILEWLLWDKQRFKGDDINGVNGRSKVEPAGTSV
jgi:hypothetical protein